MPAKKIINSQVKELSGLRIHAMPTKPLRDARVMRVASTQVVVAIDQSGNIYSTQVEGASGYCNDLGTGRIKYTIAGLIKLGALSEKAVAQHQEELARESKRQRADYEAREMLDAAKVLGLSLTRTQIRAINKAMGGGARARANIQDALGAKALEAFK